MDGKQRCLPTMKFIVIITSEVKDINKIRQRRLTQVSPEKECERIEIVEVELTMVNVHAMARYIRGILRMIRLFSYIFHQILEDKINLTSTSCT